MMKWALAVSAEHVRVYTGVLHLAVRVLCREIDPPLYRQMQDSDRRMDPGDAPLTDPVLALRAESEALEELAAEFCRLFVGPRPVCPPYASEQLGEVKAGGRAAHDIEAFMSRHALRAALHAQDAILDKDHLAVELSVLAHLLRMAAGAVTGEQARAEAWAAAHDLLHRHILPWACDYLSRLESAARYAPYTTVAHLARRVLEEAADWPAAAPPHETS
ncbi:Chaperone protein TorD [Streptomyces sp. enrichment culture]|uniref:TorD/DmsD family molecular chaperone n=1 Tax=Streptomyces sp. enrichment culture TaxID=1795815 RepID=UPI003F5622FB